MRLMLRSTCSGLESKREYMVLLWNTCPINGWFHRRRQGGQYRTPLSEVSGWLYIHPCKFNLRTNDRALRYKRLHHNVFTDTMQIGTVSRGGNIYTQVYSTEFGWTRVHPMKNKGDAHETLSLFFKRASVLPKMVMYGSKEHTLG